MAVENWNAGVITSFLFFFLFLYSQNRDSQTLLPLSVKQISEAFQSSDDKTNFLIDGVDVNNVSLSYTHGFYCFVESLCKICMI